MSVWYIIAAAVVMAAALLLVLIDADNARMAKAADHPWLAR
jgi:hypothetical protein